MEDYNEYFKEHNGNFWEWDWDQGHNLPQSVALTNAGTIALVDYIIVLLENLLPKGWPTFDALLMAVAATNPTAKKDIALISDMLKTSFGEDYLKHYEQLDKAIKALETLSDTPDEFRTGEKRLLLLQTVFGSITAWHSPEVSKLIFNGYKESPKEAFFVDSQEFSVENALVSLSLLAKVNEAFPSVKSLLNAVDGIVELPEITGEVAQDSITAAPDNAPDFITELANDIRTFTVGSLVRHLWGGLRIPMHHNVPGRQPLGGIADLSNKGDFDKLLISEFANDDDVFTSRIANNEALYIQREVPPQPDKPIRILAVDSSIRSWGTPRTLGLAAALAVATHPKTDFECRTYAVGQGFAPINFESVDTVADGLMFLSPSADAAEGYAQLMQSPESKGAEVFVITTQENLTTPGMQVLLREYESMVTFIIATDNTGNVDVYKVQNKGRKKIQSMALDLADLWSNPPLGKKGKAGKKTETGWVRGDVVVSENYPILFPLPGQVLARFYLDDFICLITTKGKLCRTKVESIHHEFYVEDKIHGCEYLLEDLSVVAGGIYALRVNEVNEYILCAYYHKREILSVLNLNTRSYKENRIQLPGVEDVVLHSRYDHFLAFNRKAKLLYVIDDTLPKPSIEQITYENDVEIDYDNAQREIKKLHTLSGSSVHTNLSPVGIGNDCLLLGKYRLDLFMLDDERHSYISLNRNTDTVQYKTEYDKKSNTFTFAEGSTITLDKKGIIILTSSNELIPNIYIPLSMNHSLAMGSDREFCGNPYFYNAAEHNLKKITVAEFQNRYLQPFIYQIIKHAPSITAK